MLTTEQLWTSTAVTCLPTYELRQHGGTEDERPISIPPGKHSIGSGPRCSLRLEAVGVQPMECLIVNDANGLRVRRWSENARVNGQSFDETSLAPGDVLMLGPVELEVIALPTDANTADDLASGPVTDTWGSSELTDSTVISDDSTKRQSAADQAPGVQHENSVANARRRNRRVLAYVRRQRQEHAELVARIDGLKECVELAISDSILLGHQATESPAETLEENSEPTEPDHRTEALEIELGGVREQLATREEDLSQARFSIDALERQLIDSQHTMNAFAEERLVLEQQFNELESRLAEYVQRIQELERHLDQVCESRADVAASVPSDVIESSETLLAVDATSALLAPVDQEEPATEIAELENQEIAEEPSYNTPADTSDNQDAGDTIRAEAVDFVAEASEPPAEDEVFVDTVAEDISEPSDVPLEQASGVSLWRDEPVDVADESDEAPEKNFSEPASFLDRYAHLFSNDEESTEPPSAPEPPKPAMIVAPAEDAHADEESVEQYMAKLLERMRGPSDVTPQVTRVVPEVESAKPEEPAIAECDTDEMQPAHEPIMELTELKSRESVPELASDRRAMRELANQSARHALGVHLARKLRRKTRWGIVKSTIGGTIGLFLLLKAPGLQSLQFAAGSVAAVASLYWGKQTIGALVEGIRIGAFDEADEPDDEVEPEASVRLPLPIDVPRTAEEVTVDEHSDCELPREARHTERMHVDGN